MITGRGGGRGGFDRGGEKKKQEYISEPMVARGDPRPLSAVLCVWKPFVGTDNDDTIASLVFGSRDNYQHGSVDQVCIFQNLFYSFLVLLFLVFGGGGVP